ncbi:ABC transporter ATP-binding protein [Pseudoflavonifractor phocaeensis]|uniref:ABC transporter ATP-binding protein n=1 Tax=Pseudoflavonifractor phocaeensis TaxID=1870988 RepID=UPI00195ED564|nr:ABC transporter ATP-binding protein [Pseudoflavonifractor phocaeensis]MBM6723865.1 ABC transporter ATP-binding protein [Pseudoflavonifractor phocaeensis]
MVTLQVERVSKLYGGFVALQEVELELGCGVYGLLGPNGAGKSTLMRIVTDLLAPSRGRVLCDGRDIHAMGADYRDLLGYLPQDFGVYPNFTAEGFLCYIARLKGLGRVAARQKTAELLELVGLTDRRKRRLGGFSGGERQRVGIAQALLNEPQVLILDEPTAGLDPQERIRFRGLLNRLGKDRLVLLSTHIVSDVESAADQVILLRRGQVIGQGTPTELLRQLEGKVWNVPVTAQEQEALAARYPCSNVSRVDGVTYMRLIADTPPTGRAEGVPANLEDLSLYHFGQTNR